eukprot:3318654-Prymnesium_polylepis.2
MAGAEGALQEHRHATLRQPPAPEDRDGTGRAADWRDCQEAAPLATLIRPSPPPALLAAGRISAHSADIYLRLRLGSRKPC